MGGAAVAQKLAAAGQDVLIVEAGGLEVRLGADAAISADHVGRSFNMPVTRCIELGGTSNQWHGICAPLDEVDFEARHVDSGFGMADHPPPAEWTLRSGGEDAGGSRRRSFRAGSSWSRGLSERLDDFDVNRAIVDRKLVHFKKPPVRWKEKLARARPRRHVPLRAERRRARVDRRRERQHRRRADRRGAEAAPCSIRADVFVVCAGALETPRLLLNSRRRLTGGIGNAHDLVGRYLLDHPVGHYCKLRFHRPTRAPLYASLPLSGHVGMMAGLMMVAGSTATARPGEPLCLDSAERQRRPDRRRTAAVVPGGAGGPRPVGPSDHRDPDQSRHRLSHPGASIRHPPQVQVRRPVLHDRAAAESRQPGRVVRTA